MKQLFLFVVLAILAIACQPNDVIDEPLDNMTSNQSYQDSRVNENDIDGAWVDTNLYLKVVDENGKGLFSDENSKGWKKENFKVLWNLRGVPESVITLRNELGWKYTMVDMYEIVNDSTINIQLDWMALFDSRCNKPVPVSTYIQWNEEDTDTIEAYPIEKGFGLYYKDITYNGKKILDDNGLQPNSADYFMPTIVK